MFVPLLGVWETRGLTARRRRGIEEENSVFPIMRNDDFCLLASGKAVRFSPCTELWRILKGETRKEGDGLDKVVFWLCKNFSSASSLESIARNNLKMAGQDEVLVIINTAQEANSDKTGKKKGYRKTDFLRKSAFHTNSAKPVKDKVDNL